MVLQRNSMIKSLHWLSHQTTVYTAIPSFINKCDCSIRVCAVLECFVSVSNLPRGGVIIVQPDQ